MSKESETNIAEFKRYLLGDLPPSEIAAIDLQIVSDEDSEEKLWWAESELIEDYLDETLAPAEVDLFEQNFLVSTERLAQLQQISLLKSFARRATAKGIAEAVCAAPSEKSFFKKLQGYFFVGWQTAALAFALVVVGLFGVVYFAGNDRTAAEKEFARVNQQNFGDLAQVRGVFVLSLFGGNLRGASGATSKLPAEKLGERVFFRLALPAPAKPSDTFRIELVKNRAVVFTQTDLRFYANPNGAELRLMLPAVVLEKGEYQIKAAAEAAADSNFVYNFAVE